ncbi:MAG TPA: hypothetical protein PK406_14200, partial [Verrucomicrobiota bacterium]|nr:hypothetical protein [Verrucomicrobiota bacterium]
WGLLAQLFLGILTVVCVVVWAFVEPHWTRKLLGAGLVVVTAALFVVCARGLQRFAPGFSESAFEQLQISHHSGSGLVSAEVTARLGEPLIRHRLPGGGETWLYSYMPSCGFGWDKKYVSVDAAGRVTDIFTNHEP